VGAPHRTKYLAAFETIARRPGVLFWNREHILATGICDAAPAAP
jgi:hypothetical protein